MQKKSEKKFKAKKSLGQNFLRSETVLKKIVETGEIKPDDTILEIGPGKGALTKKLLEHANKVIAIEKDHLLYELLQKKFLEEIQTGALKLTEKDILDFDLSSSELMQKSTSLPSAEIKYKIIANIPYNITGAILKKFLTTKNQPERMVLLVQYEVAKRIMARDGKESILSISVKTYGEPKMIMKVPARYFSPTPKVDSAVILIKNISRKFFKENKINEDSFWNTVKLGFSHKRKKLSGNLKEKFRKNIEEMKLDVQTINSLTRLKEKRAEDLSLEDWILLEKASK